MITSDNPHEQQVIQEVYDNRQEHVFRFWGELDADGRRHLLSQLEQVDFSLLDELLEKHVRNPHPEPQKNFQPPEVIGWPQTEEEIAERKKAKDLGEQYLREGRVAVFMVAGGQGSRLGYEGPKGCFRITPVQRKSIFQLHCEKILAIQKRYGAQLPLYIMTSEANHETTKDFFEENDFFGLDQVHFFKQGMMPAVDDTGRLLLSAKDSIFMNPNGHGGSIYALKESGALDHMKTKGIDTIFYMQVDNVLVTVADPVFIGYHALRGAQMSSKAVKKRSPEEKVGVIGLVDGRTSVIEYSLLPDELRYDRTKNGELRFEAGNIAIHVMDVGFLEKVYREKLPFNKAFKAVPYLDEDGELVKPGSPNAYKFEMFVFDALSKADTTVTMMANRLTEFAPVKNREGEDSPHSAQKMMSDLHRSWMQKAGITASEDAVIEISPLYALGPNELKEKLADGNVPLRYDKEIYLG